MDSGHQPSPRGEREATADSASHEDQRQQGFPASSLGSLGGENGRRISDSPMVTTTLQVWITNPI